MSEILYLRVRRHCIGWRCWWWWVLQISSTLRIRTQGPAAGLQHTAQAQGPHRGSSTGFSTLHRHRHRVQWRYREHASKLCLHCLLNHLHHPHCHHHPQHQQIYMTIMLILMCFSAGSQTASSNLIYDLTECSEDIFGHHHIKPSHLHRFFKFSVSTFPT